MDAATIEETNKLRLSMGLKPLPTGKPPADSDSDSDSSVESEDPNATYEGREAQASANFKKLQDAENAKKRREEKAAAVKKAREKAQLHANLEGKGLGDLDGDDLGAKDWLKGQKSRQKKIDKASKKQLEAEAEAKAKAKGYTAEDLSGLNVGHDMSTLLDGDDQVLTLRDTGVLDEEEGDELENVELREREKLKEKLDLKKKPRGYNPLDYEEDGDHSLLGQYDEEIYGKKRKKFALDTKGTLGDLADILQDPEIKGKELKSISLEDIADTPANDYMDISEIKVKKPKKKKSKSTRQRPADDDDVLFAPGALDTADQEMDIDSGAAQFTKKRKAVDDNFVDDEDLQATLAMSRRDALKKRKRVRPADLAKQVKEAAEEEAQAAAAEQKATVEEGGLVLDEITGFLGAVGKDADEDEAQKARAKKVKQEEATTAMEDESDDEGDAQMNDAPDIEESAEDKDWTTTGVDEEQYVGSGLGATLNLLRDRGLVEKNDSDDHSKWRHHAMFEAEKNRLLAQVDEQTKKERERERNSGFLDKMSAAEREAYRSRANQQRDFQASRALNDMFQKKYQPNFELKYVDEHGRNLDKKGAFKHLSHAFHGKTSGKGKTSKLLQKIEDEKKRMAQPILEASKTGLEDAAAGLKKKREAGVRLN